MKFEKLQKSWTWKSWKVEQLFQLQLEVEVEKDEFRSWEPVVNVRVEGFIRAHFSTWLLVFSIQVMKNFNFIEILIYNFQEKS